MRAVGATKRVFARNEVPALSNGEQRVASEQAQMVKLESQSLDEADLEREAKADEQNYLLYLSQRERERAAEAPLRRNELLRRSELHRGAANVSTAVPQAIPVVPAYGPLSIVLISFALAVLVSLPVAYTIDYFDPFFQTPAQVREILGVPVVVAVPRRTALGRL